MLNFARLFIAGVLFLFAGSTLANETEKTKIQLKSGPCSQMHSRYQCNNYRTGECFWDDADQRCENRNNYEDRCSRIHCPNTCLNTRGCFWDYDDQRCESR